MVFEKRIVNKVKIFWRKFRVKFEDVIFAQNNSDSLVGFCYFIKPVFCQNFNIKNLNSFS